MIAEHHPKIFNDKVLVGLSSKEDGTMKFTTADEAIVRDNQVNFLKKLGIAPEATTLVALTYDTGNFTKYRTVTEKDKGVGMKSPEGIEYADALVVNQPSHALLLPLADCIGAVIHDEAHNVLMVSHLGRHNVEQNGAAKSIEYLQENFSTDPAEVKIWLTPSVGRDTYPLHGFEGRSLEEVARAQFASVGVQDTNIASANIDTAHSQDYYSHSQHLQGKDEPGRFAVVAVLL